MQGIKFIAGIKSFLIRSGIERIINEFKGAELVASVEEPHLLYKVVRNERFNFLIISKKMEREIPEKQLPAKSNTILISDSCTPEEVNTGYASIIEINDDKATIADKISSVAKQIAGDSFEEESSTLSEREQDIVRQIALGKTNKEIAEILFISTHTAMTHRKNITKKLGIKTVSGLTVYAILNKIITIEEAQ